MLGFSHNSPHFLGKTNDFDDILVLFSSACCVCKMYQTGVNSLCQISNSYFFSSQIAILFFFSHKNTMILFKSPR